jgi:hypothetical protein
MDPERPTLYSHRLGEAFPQKVDSWLFFGCRFSQLSDSLNFRAQQYTASGPEAAP